ncbi:hypothetical protein FHS43_005951 [Streptosporangium becharense]|uniref:Transposase IS4-like domain-containing protein n=1 Tax=Streptosporangium becharense TaxID=1816182 RepID=A0A7W9MHI7_9ACTN|nr:hypothetical protein [Streptosporangium becharense]MBB2914639.1 hypothetical protein [Streptosporangium becharense]MBB5820960.1 hypothetical protein [Streptosporangium becharense]
MGPAQTVLTSATGAQVLGRLRNNRRTPILAMLTDGSYLSVIGALQIRVIEAQVTVICVDGTTFTGTYRLATTLTDARRYPAAALVRLYHQRWEHESAYYALRHTIMQGRILRSGDPAGLEQEMSSVLTLYQLLRTVMVDAAESRPGTDPDRCSFSLALHAARDLVIQPRDAPGTITGLVATIGHRILAALLPPRRPRVSTRKVKSPISRYNERLDDGRPDRSRIITDLDITLLPPPPTLPAASRDERPMTAADRRRQHQVLALLHQNPHRPWKARDIAHHLGDVTLNTMYRQLSRWAVSQLIRKIRPGVYTAEPISAALLPSAQRA